MSTEQLAQYIEKFAAYSMEQPLMILLFIVLFMAIESSFIPFPSEVVMIPAGFLIGRGELMSSSHGFALVVVIFFGLFGSMLGAYVNYYLALWLGRPFLHKYGKYFFLSEHSLNRAEEVFREYGEVVTFVCRLLPAIRQLISIPAGLARMRFWRFSLWTALGAGIWTAILTLVGYAIGRSMSDMTYPELVRKGGQMISDHFLWILIAVVVCFVGYVFIHKKIMGSAKPKA